MNNVAVGFGSNPQSANVTKTWPATGGGIVGYRVVLQLRVEDLEWAEKIGVRIMGAEASRQKRLRSEWVELHFEAIFFKPPAREKKSQ